MKKLCPKLFAVLFAIVLFGICCSKDQESVSKSSKMVNVDVATENDSHLDARGNCRLAKSASTFGDIEYTYNKRGLLDTYTAYYLGGAIFKHQYNYSGRLIKSRLYYGSTVILTIDFFYNRAGKVYRELWYDGSSSTVIDDLKHFYDHRGLRTKSVSEFANYFITFRYDYFGSLTEWVFYDGGNPSAKGEYTYLGRFKNPSGAIPGLDYDYYSANGVYSLNKWYSTSEKFIVWVNGVATVIEDQDPRKTTMIGNDQHYATHAEFTDRISPDKAIFDFTYENCGSCKPHQNNNKYSGIAGKSYKSTIMYKMLRKPLRNWRH